MIFSTVNKIPAFVLEKLDILFQLLRERKEEYEFFAGRVNDKQLKRTVLSLAQETNQYANELSGQLESIRGCKTLVPFKSNAYTIASGKETSTIISGQNEIMKSCEVSEKRMITAYRGIVNEPLLHENLQKLITCQLNGLIRAFMQLRLLNTSLNIIS